VVYVDDLIRTQRSRQWPYDMSCHMIADTTEELLTMAKRLGLNPAWVQSKGAYFEHFDLTKTKREEAIRLGATAIPWRNMARIWRGKKNASTNGGHLEVHDSVGGDC
jgi:hypothetical protein